MTVDPVQFGGLVESVATLTEEVKQLRASVAFLRDQLSGGKGVITGIMIAAGGVGASVSHVLDRVFAK